ncbi:MAG: alpha-galactosidase [Anaerolineales bacterium]
MTVRTLENATIQLTLKPELARWSLSSRGKNSPSLENVRLSLIYRRGPSRVRLQDRWHENTISETEAIESPHGLLHQINLQIGGSSEDVQCTLTFALAQDLPLVIWKLVIKNQANHPIYIDEIELFSAGYIHRYSRGPGGQIYFPDVGRQSISPARHFRRGSHPTNLIFFSNGWQSWSRSASYRFDDHYQQTRLGFLRAPMVKNAGTPSSRRAGLIASDMYGVLGDQKHRGGLLLGFLSQKQHFGSLETWLGGTSPALRLWANGDDARLDPGSQIETDWACIQYLHLDNPDPMAPYIEAVAREHNLKPRENSPSGWCSWYQFSGEDYIGNLRAEDIKENLEAIHSLNDQLPLEVVQIDDGFETQVGDWFSFKKDFPSGVSPLASEIRNKGFIPGLWLAPFIVHPRSNLSSQHRDWLLRNSLGLPVNAGFLWNSFTRALDLTHPDALGYVKDVIMTTTKEWGFPYLKLDFLYAAALPGQFQDKSQTRAQVLRSGLEAIREAAGNETFLLGCGCPLGPAIGIMDGMRIGADTARRWKPSYRGIQSLLKDEVSFPSAFNAVHNALTRADMHRRWWINDPDCLLLRPKTQLTKTEVESIATVIALTGGSFFISDHIPDLPPERLNIAKCLLPLIGKRSYILDWMDSKTPSRIQLDLEGPCGRWHLIAMFNWEDEIKNLSLNLNEFYLPERGEMYAREFWSDQVYKIPNDPNSAKSLILSQVPPHGVILFALRPHHPYTPQYLGSNLHISQGLEVADWQTADGLLTCEIERPGQSQGEIEIAIPKPVKSASLNGTPIPWVERLPGGNLFNLEFNRTARIEIRY